MQHIKKFLLLLLTCSQTWNNNFKKDCQN